MSDSLNITIEVPCVWHRAVDRMSISENILLLRVLALLETKSSSRDEHINQENSRLLALEARLDLCLQLLGRLLHPQPLLPPVALTLSSEQASWHSKEVLVRQTQGCLAIYWSSQLPQPLLLPAIIDNCQAERQGWRIHATFIIEDEELQNWFDKTIFRYHRHQIMQRHQHEHP